MEAQHRDFLVALIQPLAQLLTTQEGQREVVDYYNRLRSKPVRPAESGDGIYDQFRSAYKEYLHG